MYGEKAYPYVALAKHDTINETVLAWLIEKGKLPRDVLVRAFVHEEDSYSESANQAVLAALNDDPLPSFVVEPLPNAFTFYVAANHDYETGGNPVAMLDGDFHELRTLRRIANSLEINPNLMYTLWQRVIAEIEPELGLSIEQEKNSTPYSYYRNRAGYILLETVIRDEPTLEVFQDSSLRLKLSKGIGRRCLLPLGYMLADNHPELFEELDAARQKMA